MAGYYGYSMSNNAVAAYEDGEKPFSKWTKRDIIAALEELVHDGEVSEETLNIARRMPAASLKNKTLRQTSWHHTSMHYNETDFYSVDDELELTERDLADAKETAKLRKEKPAARRATCKYLVWSGSRRHPRATEVTEDGTIIGNWFTSDSGVRKSIYGNGFEILSS
nr:MAG TPA: hypothetical protein [Caudoviricetes sp.]